MEPVTPVTGEGLTPSVWTTPERGERVVTEIQSGGVYVNELVNSVPRVSFRGIKDSGYLRELVGGGIRAFPNRKTVWVLGPATREEAPIE